MNINISAVYHEAKSKYAYAYDNETIHIRLRTAKNDVDRVQLIYGDPFNWGPKKDKEPSKENNEWVWRNENNETLYMKKEYSTATHDYYFAAVKPKYRRVKYIFVLHKGPENILFGCRTVENLLNSPEKEKDLFNYFNFPFINPIDIYHSPDWVKDTVWYQIFPERFHNGNPLNDPKGVLPWGSIEKVRNDMFFGGDLEGIIEKLDYIQAIGVTGIYFTPIFKSPSTHKYDTESYFEIDPQFGDVETLKKLVQEAHARGIRVMLDAVYNHCGYNHPFWQDVLKHGENSPYKDYFHIKKFPAFDGDPKHFKFEDEVSMLNFDSFAFTPFMPKWNTEHPLVKEYLYNVSQFWIRECDIDAYRLDVSNEVDHEFWRGFKKACDEAKKDFFIVGENWDESNPWLRGDQMQSVMNYEVMFACWNFFGKGIFRAQQFKDDLSRILTMYPKNVSQNLFNLLDSHDSTRILTICNDDVRKVYLAYLFLLTYSGTPSIYYGSEIALAGGHDPDNRRCMIWDEDKQNLHLLNHIQKLISLRHTHESFKAVDMEFIQANEETNLLIYKKAHLTDSIIILMNNSNSALHFEAPLELKNQTKKDLYSNQFISFGETIALSPYDFLILQL